MWFWSHSWSSQLLEDICKLKLWSPTRSKDYYIRKKKKNIGNATLFLTIVIFLFHLFLLLLVNFFKMLQLPLIYSETEMTYDLWNEHRCTIAVVPNLLKFHVKTWVMQYTHLSAIFSDTCVFDNYTPNNLFYYCIYFVLFLAYVWVVLSQRSFNMLCPIFLGM